MSSLLAAVQALTLLAAIGLSGYLLAAALLARTAPDDGQFPAQLDRLERLFAALALGICTVGVAGILLADSGRFSVAGTALLATLAALPAGLWARERGTLQWHATPVDGREWLALALLTALCLVLFARPHQTITGGADAGVYVNVGAALARTHGLLQHEPDLAALDPALTAGLLRGLPPANTVEYMLFPGFYRADGQPGLVIPQFLTLHPLWIGLAYAIGGVRAGLLMSPLWALLGVWALYLYARRLVGTTYAWLPALLLAITPLQIYFARYATAEPLTQFLVWVTLWAFTAFVTRHRGGALWAALAGLTIGALFLTRIDMIFVLLLPLGRGLALLVTRRQRPGEGWFWGTLAITGGLAAVQALLFSRPYTLDTYGAVFGLLWARLGVIGLIGLALLAILLYLVTAQRTRMLGWAQQIGSRPWPRHVLAGGIVLLAGYGYWIRPRLGETIFARYWYSGTDIPLAEHLNLVRLGWFITPLGIGLAVFGLVVLVERERWRTLWPLLALGGSFTVFYLYNILNNPLLVYAMRRHVPVTVPFLMLAAAYGLVWLWRPPARIRQALAAGIFLALAGWLLYNGRLYWRQPDLAGTVAQVDELAARFAVNDVLLFVDDLPVGAGVVLGTPLHFMHGLAAFDLQEATLDRDALDRQIDAWQAAGRMVYLLVKYGQPALLPPEQLSYQGQFQWRASRLEQSYEHAPARTDQADIVLEIFQVRD